jgi:tetratricopeptide (TPR) repeat protein
MRVFLFLTLSLALCARSALATDLGNDATPARSIDAEVERHATRGQRLLDRGQTQEAIAAFRRAYELRADARFLYDIAECYRQLDLADQAIHFYQRYLSVAPDAPDREEVEAQIAALEKHRPALAKAPPAGGAPNLANDVVIIPVPETPASPGSPLGLDAPSPERRPIWKRWWVWAAAGALVVGGAALALTLGRDGTDVPATALGDKSFY